MWKFMNSLDWIMRSRLLFIEGEAGGGDGGSGGGGGGGGAPAGGGDSGGSGGGGTPAAPSTPAAAVTPATPTAVPVTPSPTGAAPLSTQEPVSSLVDENGRPQRELGETPEAYLARHRSWKDAQPKDGEKTPEQLATEKAAADKAAADKLAAEQKKVADAGKTPEQLAAEKKVADDKKAADDAAAKKLEEEGASLFDDFSPVPTEKLAELAKDPEFQKALERSGISQDDLFATARLADKTGKYQQVFPTLEAAEHARGQAVAFHQLEDSFTNIKAGDLPSTTSFISDVLLPMSYLRDDNGQVMKDKATGLPLTDGTVFAMLENVFDVHTNFLADKVLKTGGESGIGSITSLPAFSKILDNFAKVAEKIGGDRGGELKAAVDILKGCGKAGAPSGNEDELPENVKREFAESRRQKAENDKQKQELDVRESAAHAKREADFKTAVLNESSAEIDKMLGGFLDKTSLKDDQFLRSTVIQKIRDALYESMSSDDMYLSQRDGLTLGGMTKKTHEAWKSLNVKEAKARLKTIADPILAEAGAKKISRAQERQQTITTQVDRSKQEPKGGVSTALPHAQTQDPHELLAQAKQNLRDAGKEVDTASVLTEFRRLKSVPAA